MDTDGLANPRQLTWQHFFPPIGTDGGSSGEAYRPVCDESSSALQLIEIKAASLALSTHFVDFCQNKPQNLMYGGSIQSTCSCLWWHATMGSICQPQWVSSGPRMSASFSSGRMGRSTSSSCLWDAAHWESPVQDDMIIRSKTWPRPSHGVKWNSSAF